MKKQLEQTTGSTQHLVWIDLLRAFAIGTVLLVHVTENIYDMNDESFLSVSAGSQLFALTLFAIGRIGVPLFLMISGWLLLDRDYNSASCRRFWKTKWFPLLVITEVWILVYYAFWAVYQREVNLKLIIKCMLFLYSYQSNDAFSHMWYMNKLLGLYLFIPLIAMAMKRIPVKLLKFPALIVFFYVYLVPVFNVVRIALGKDSFSAQPALDFAGGTYGCILICGYLCKSGVLKKIESRWLEIWGIVNLVLTVALEVFAYRHDYAYNVWYDCGFLLITCICIFEIVSRMETIPMEKWVRSLARYSFGIYLIHQPIRIALNDWIPIGLRGLKIVVVYILTLAISWILVALISRIPVIGKKIFYLKDR